MTDLERKEQGLGDREVHVKALQEELRDAHRDALGSLEKISGLTVHEARQQLIERSKDLVRHELAREVRQMEEEARSDARRRARALVADSLQRVAASHTAEATVTVVELASDDLKGRIIGREGRNIRALEHLTGVDFIIDDTPHAVVLSSFDPLRREVARLALDKLIEDGRIHPARIEEMYYQAKAELEEHVMQAGEQAVFEANCGEFHEELVRMLGRLRYRTSYGQNVLKHTLEVVHLSGIMAAELKAGVKTTKRAALLHDIGKAVSHEVDGSHALISAQLARRCGESEGVVHAIEAHHYEVQPQTVEAVLLITADAISASRPGARGESLENYIRRLEALEQIATAKTGVAKAYALQAGREIRVIVEPSEVDDDARRTALPRDRARDRGSARVPGPGQGHRDPGEPGDRGGEIDARAAARRWATVWAEAWPAADVAAIARAVRARRDVLLAPVPAAAGPEEYVRWAFDDQESASCRFGEPVVDGSARRHRLVGGDHLEGRLAAVARRHVAPALRRRRPRRRAARRLGGRRTGSTSCRTGRRSPRATLPTR